jgi:hypothetical protein
MSLLLELLRLSRSRDGFPGSPALPTLVEAPLATAQILRLWAGPDDGPRFGVHLFAGVFEDDRTDSETPTAAYGFWVFDEAGCSRRLVPFRYISKSANRDELFAELRPGQNRFRIYSQRDHSMLCRSLTCWEGYLRASGAVTNFRRLQILRAATSHT